MTIVEWDPDKKDIKRTDPSAISYAFRSTCAYFRKYTNAELCKQCDCLHAKLLIGLPNPKPKSNDEAFVSKLRERIQELEPLSFFSDLYQKPRLLRARNGRLFLKYQCPMLGYTEFVFPIFTKYTDSVMGVLFTGEMMFPGNDHEDDLNKDYGLEIVIDGPQMRSSGFFGILSETNEKRAERIRDDFFRKNSKKFMGDPNHMMTTVEIEKGIRERWRENTNSYNPLLLGRERHEDIDDNKLNSYIKAVKLFCYEMEDIEWPLETEYEHRRNKMVEKEMKKIENSFFQTTGLLNCT